jgi:colanic acid biosynthesis glycosyl transferase WcaI
VPFIRAKNKSLLLKILIVGLNFHPELIGIGKYTGELATYLVGSGHQVRVITAPPYYPHWRVQPGYSGSQYRWENWQGVGVIRCPLWVPGKPSGVKRVLHLLSFALSSFPVLLGQCYWKPDLVLCIAPSFFNAPFALFAARLSGAKAWLHVQDFELDAAASLGMLPAGNLIANSAGWVERWLLRRFDRISTISNRMLERLAQKGVASEKTFLFPNWVDTRLIFPLSASQISLKKELRIPDDKIIVLYAGNMGRKQGLEIVIETARRLQTQAKIYFVLCGDGAVQSGLVRDAEGLANVQFLPLQPLEKLNQLLNIADIHILPQRADAADLVMPSKLSGMLASGRAVIATANLGTEVAEVVGQLGVVVPPQDALALTDAILELANDPDRMRSFGQKGVSWVVANWSKEKALNDFCEYMTKNIAQVSVKKFQGKK